MTNKFSDIIVDNNIQEELTCAQVRPVLDVFISGEIIELVVLTEEIARDSQWYNWFNDEEITENMQKHYFPNTACQQVEFYKTQVLGNKSKLQLGILSKNDGVFIGVVSLNDINYINRSCEFSAIIGEKKYHNLEIFKEAASLVIKHAFETLNMNRVYSGSISKQIHDLMCRVIGFSTEGIARQAVYKNGRYHDVYLHGLIKGEVSNDEI